MSNSCQPFPEIRRKQTLFANYVLKDFPNNQTFEGGAILDIWILLDPSCIVATVKFGISNRFTAGDKPENNVK